jgi:hypothetical protein
MRKCLLVLSIVLGACGSKKEPPATNPAKPEPAAAAPVAKPVAAPHLTAEQQAYRIACVERDDDFACAEAGLALMAIDARAALPLLQRACDTNASSDACRALIKLHTEGAPNVAADPHEAELVATMMCKRDKLDCRCDTDRDCGKDHYCIPDEHRCYSYEVQ